MRDSRMRRFLLLHGVLARLAFGVGMLRGAFF